MEGDHFCLSSVCGAALDIGAIVKSDISQRPRHTVTVCLFDYLFATELINTAALFLWEVLNRND